MIDQLPDSDKILDSDRLTALQATALLDSPPDEAFDRLTRLASKLLRTQSAMVVLVDDERQSYKSHVGLPEPWATRQETPLAYSFCRHLICTGAPLVIENAREDQLVKDSPSIRAFCVVAFAGIPLVVVNGHVRGAFCVIDSQPRAWTNDEVTILTELAALATAVIDARTADTALLQSEERYRTLVKSLQESEQLFRRLAENAPDIVYRYQVRPKPAIAYISPSATRILGYSLEECYSDPWLWLRIADRDDVPLAQKVFFVTEASSVTLRLRHRDGHTVWMDIRHERVCDEGGRLVAFEGIARDVTEQKLAEQALRAEEQRYRELLVAEKRHVQDLSLLDNVRTALMRELNMSRIFQTVVEAVVNAFGYTQVSIHLVENGELAIQYQVGYERSFERIKHRDGVIGTVAYTGKPMLIQDVQASPLYMPAREDMVSEVCVPLLDQNRVVGVLNLESRGMALTEADLRLMTGLSVHVSLAIGRARLYTESKQAEARLRIQNEELAALHETTLGLINQLDSATLLESILARSAALVGTAHGYLYVVEPNHDELVVVSGTGIFAVNIGYRLGRGEGLAGRVWESGRIMSVENYNSWSGHQTDLEWLDIRAVIGVPLQSGGEVIGVLGLGYQEVGRTFGPEVETLLGHFGQLASLALTNAKLYEAAKQELAERKQAEEMLAHLALHDPLTDLPNRTLFGDRLKQELLTAERGDKPFALLIMDLDRFKEVNDTLGHHCGDMMLQQVATRLSKTIRASDTVARLGGDEFALLLPRADVRAARRISRKLSKSLEQPFDLDGHRLTTGGSVGIALYPDHGTDAETLLRRADLAMFTAKRRDGGYAVYTMSEEPRDARRLKLIEELHNAIAKDELVLYYQPTVSHKTNQTTGVEALVRWRHPKRGLMWPDEFLGLAEHTELIKPFSQWIFNAALRQCREWQERGMAVPVSVNLSVAELHDPALPARLKKLLEAWGISPKMLCVEVTEEAITTDAGRALAALHGLHAVGIRLEIDNFGTGNSSLGQLKHLPIDQIKIDRSLIRDALKDESDAVIVRSTIDLGHNLGLTVVAEGVEDQATWDLLTALSCDEGQGYFLTRPVPPESVEPWLRPQPPP